MPVRPTPPRQAISTRRVAAWPWAYRNAATASAIRSGSRKSGQQIHTDSHASGAGDRAHSYTPSSGRASTLRPP